MKVHMHCLTDAAAKSSTVGWNITVLVPEALSILITVTSDVCPNFQAASVNDSSQ